MVSAKEHRLWTAESIEVLKSARSMVDDSFKLVTQANLIMNESLNTISDQRQILHQQTTRLANLRGLHATLQSGAVNVNF